MDNQNQSINVMNNLNDKNEFPIDNNNYNYKQSLKFQIPPLLNENLLIEMKNDFLNIIKCKHCGLIPINPIILKKDDQVQKENFNVICKGCYSKIYHENININKIDEQYSSHIKSIIHKSMIHCINSKCNWKGELYNLENHLNKECLYQLLNCPNKYCNKKIIKKDLNSHLIQCDYLDKIIKVKCNYCNDEFNIKNISEHFEKCNELVIECENFCGKKLKRKNMEIHIKKECLLSKIKCPFWDKGCKKLIKRKFLSDHYKLEQNNHLMLENQNFNKKDNSFQNIEEIIKELRKEEQNKKIQDPIELNEEKEEIQLYSNLNSIKNNNIKNYKDISESEKLADEKKNKIFDSNNDKIINQKKEKNKYLNDDNYIPFTGNPIKFITDIQNINKKIIIFENEKIKYSGNFYNNIDLDKYYFILSETGLDLNSKTNFLFNIYPPNSSNNNNNNSSLPFIAFGLFIFDDLNINNINFPGNSFYCIDLDSRTYINGKISNPTGNIDKLNTNGYISLSYNPKNKSMIIKDNYDLEINFNNLGKIDKNSDLRICFIFKGQNRVIIEYNY